MHTDAPELHADDVIKADSKDPICVYIYCRQLEPRKNQYVCPIVLERDTTVIELFQHVHAESLKL